MLVSIDWIKDFVNLENIDAKTLAQKLTLATCEVESFKIVGDHLKKIRVAEIIDIKSHPDADKLKLVSFNLGDKRSEVVCGAPNVRVGLKVPYAPIGVTLPNGLVLTPKKIRGILSEGMLCSEIELGIGTDTQGLMELPHDALIGQDFLTFLDEKEDVIIDIDNKSLTHRPDLWGHLGLAREYAAIFDTKFNNPFNEKWTHKIKENFTEEVSPIIPKIEGESSCLGYCGLTVKNIEIKESPLWMQKRLLATGLRPINNIVDISNYVMLELGAPLHIFDRKNIKNDTIIIKKLGTHQKFVTLDNVERELLPEDTVICDSEEALVLGGIMGGLSSSVSENTTDIFIEVANWEPAATRKFSTRLGLRTDASQRLEKYQDTQLLERTALRTLELILKLCPESKVIGKLEKVGPELENKKETLKVRTSYDSICSQIGKEIDAGQIKKILEALDFKVTTLEDETIEVSVPSYRATKDIEYENDIIEEVGRMIGYDSIIPIAPMAPVKPVHLNYAQKLHRKIKDFMVLHAKAIEIYTHPLISKKMLEVSQWEEFNESLKLVNALTIDHDRVRPSLIPSILKSLALNQKYYESFRLFEIGRVFHKDTKNFSKENNQLIFAISDKEHNPFIQAVDIVENLFQYTNIPGILMQDNGKFKNPVLPVNWKGNHPNEYLHVQVMGKYVGGITSLHPRLMKEFKLKGHLVIGVIDLGHFENRELKDKIKYKPLPKFPSSTFDCTVMVNPKVNCEEVLKALRKTKIKEMVQSKIAKVFNHVDGSRAVTVRAIFADENKTLSGEWIKAAEEKIIKTLDKEGLPLKQN